MKKSILLIIALAVFTGFASAQTITGNNLKIKKNKKDLTEPQQLKNQKKSGNKDVFWNWDTITAYDTVSEKKRYTQTFDSAGNVKVYSEQFWQPVGWVWVNEWRWSYSYDANGNIISEVDELFQNNTWVNDWKGMYAYDTAGNLILKTEQTWVSGAWENLWKDTITFDSSGREFTRTLQTWNNSVWENYNKWISSYDSAGNIDIYTSYQWVNNAWVSSRRYSYSYDNNGNMLTKLIEQWTTSQWTNSYHYTYTYDGNDNMLTYLEKQWNTTNTVWDSTEKWTMTYTGNNMFTRLVEKWQNGSWKNIEKRTNTYDASGNLLTRIIEKWQTNVWINFSKFSFTYDGNGNSETGKYETWKNGSWHKNNNYSLWLYYSNSSQIFDFYSNYHRYETTYRKSGNTDLPDFINNTINISVYPNPATDIISVSLNQKHFEKTVILKASVYSLQGRFLFGQNIKKENTNLNISKLAKGMYFLKVECAEGIAVRRFVKE